jgi:hypothetical protein
LLLAVFGGAASAQPAGGGKLKTVTYDVADLIYKPGGKGGYDRIDDLIRELLTSADLNTWNGTGPDGSSLQELNGTQLEVRATPAQHDVIVDLLGVLRRRVGLAVDLHGDLYELDRAVYEKDLRPWLGKGPQGLGSAPAAVIEDDVAALLKKRATHLRSGRARVAPGRAAPFLSARQAFTYLARPGVQDTAFHGLTLRAAVNVTGDRRRVRLALTQDVTELVEVRKRDAVDPETGNEVKVDDPDLVRTSVTVRLEVDDGYNVLVPVRYLPQAVKDKDRVRVLLVRPEIWIEEEEKLRKEQEEQKKKAGT